jgi:hypothetical protein
MVPLLAWNSSTEEGHELRDGAPPRMVLACNSSIQLHSPEDVGKRACACVHIHINIHIHVHMDACGQSNAK